MNLTAIRVLLFSFVFSVGYSPLHGQVLNDFRRIDTLMDLLSAHNKFMGSVAVSKEGKLVYSKAVGLADMENRVDASPKTIYRIGSVSKMFTSVMIFQLIGENKLTLDTRLSEFYPEIGNADKITIREMLLHRSGIWSVTDDSLYQQWYTKPKTHDEIVAMIKSHSPLFQPNEKSAYSNSNFILLGYILETLTGKDYATNLQERVCKKAGLRSTRYGDASNTADNESYSYSLSGTDWIKENETDMSIPHGAGAVVSTTADMCLFADALFAGDIIPESALDEMKKTEGEYGKGIFPMPFYELMGFGHTGGIDGFRSVLVHYPSENLSLAVCSNALNYNQNEILIGLLSIIQGKAYKLPEFKTVEVPPRVLKKYEGVYSSESFPLKLTIKLDGEILTAQATGQSAFPLEALSETEFKFDPAGIKIIFSEGNHLTIKQGGMDILMTRE